MHGADTVPGVCAAALAPAESTEIFPNFCNKKNDRNPLNPRDSQGFNMCSHL